MGPLETCIDIGNHLLSLRKDGKQVRMHLNYGKGTCLDKNNRKNQCLFHLTLGLR